MLDKSFQFNFFLMFRLSIYQWDCSFLRLCS